MRARAFTCFCVQVGQPSPPPPTHPPKTDSDQEQGQPPPSPLSTPKRTPRIPFVTDRNDPPHRSQSASAPGPARQVHMPPPPRSRKQSRTCPPSPTAGPAPRRSVTHRHPALDRPARSERKQLWYNGPRRRPRAVAGDARPRRPPAGPCRPRRSHAPGPYRAVLARKSLSGGLALGRGREGVSIRPCSRRRGHLPSPPSPAAAPAAMTRLWPPPPAAWPGL